MAFDPQGGSQRWGGHFLIQEISALLISEVPLKGRRQIKRDVDQLASGETSEDDTVPTESAV